LTSSETSSPSSLSSKSAELERSAAPIGEQPENSSETSPGVKEVKVQIDAPLVFHATGPPPKTAVEDVGVQIYSDPSVAVATSAAADSAGTTKPPKRGFFRRVGGAFAAIFR
jgi:hypothetical protein